MMVGRKNVERAMLVFVLAVLAVFEATSTSHSIDMRQKNRRRDEGI